MKRISLILNYFLIAVFCIASVSCDETPVVDKEETKVPEITGFSPASGTLGQEVIITGTGLSGVTEVQIGGQPALLSQKINDRAIAAKITAGSRSGAITVSGRGGTASSTEQFTVNYVTPTLEVHPSEAYVGDEIMLEGVNLNAVSKVTFQGSGAEIVGEIISRDRYLIRLKVPYSNEVDVDIHLYYFNGTSETTVSTSGKPFGILSDTPIVNNIPTSGTTEETITITGTSLNQVDYIYFGTHKGDIVTKTSNEIKVVIPDEFSASGNVEVSMTYFGEAERAVLVNSFHITVVKIYYRPGITLSGASSNSPAFYIPHFGMQSDPCSYLSGYPGNKDHVVLLISWAANGAQIICPQYNNSLARYNCNGENIIEASYRPSYHVRFKQIFDSGAEAKYFNAVKNKTLGEISVDEVIKSGIDLKWSELAQVARHKHPDAAVANGLDYDTYNKTHKEGMYIGGVNLFAVFDSTGPGGDDIPVKVGFIEMTEVKYDGGTASNRERYAVIKANIYYEKNKSIRIK